MPLFLSLKIRFLLLMGLLVTLAGLLGWFIFQATASRIIENWGRHVVEVQVRYDTSRLLKPLERELALAQQMAHSPTLKRWIQQPDQREWEAEALRELESFRSNFLDQSYFLAMRESGAYYHNNRHNEFAAAPLRYHLNPEKPDDAWFYRLIEEGRDFHINVNPDTELGVVKLWIDVLVRDDADQIIGMVGTGLELERFLQETIDLGQPGIRTLFIDLHGAIQLYQDVDYIDYASIVKPEGQKKTLDLLVDKPADRLRLADLMRKARAHEDVSQVEIAALTLEGRRYLAGIAFLPSLGWYELTLLDLDQVLPKGGLVFAAMLFVCFLLVGLLFFHFSLHRHLFRPIAQLERAMLRIQEGVAEPVDLPKAQGEMARLIEHFVAMAQAITQDRAQLEQKVEERTQALHRLARIDPVTELTNRRGMTERLQQEVERHQRDRHTYALIWLDLDFFKEINDQLGHASGDEALQQVAQILKNNVRPYDEVARWGGDEFLILLTPCDRPSLAQISERIRHAVAVAHPKTDLGSGPGLSVSIGACLVQPGTDFEAALHKADEALYRAKEGGRNRVCILEQEIPTLT
ncbi:sensor domain-containing diguanylate cyclase [Nitrincola tapanii]|uniref:diguanylate cyclase n=1 Tax=Nitrincola tapanii TaxID=1708751 RepID=A0A5A9W3J5_9GAMM|nr:diguanylate cyclase [Nitrincola tapanii]KAA0874121.1 diguanylate cyclase [Nitrincola tapanii]